MYRDRGKTASTSGVTPKTSTNLTKTNKWSRIYYIPPPPCPHLAHLLPLPSPNFHNMRCRTAGAPIPLASHRRQRSMPIIILQLPIHSIWRSCNSSASKRRTCSVLHPFSPRWEDRHNNPHSHNPKRHLSTTTVTASITR